jgi:hypothetical protein
MEWGEERAGEAARFDMRPTSAAAIAPISTLSTSDAHSAEDAEMAFSSSRAASQAVADRSMAVT